MNRMTRWLPLWWLFSMAAAADTVGLSPARWQQLAQVQQALAEQHYEQAAEQLQALSRQPLSRLAEAYVLQLQGQLALARQQEAQALAHFASAYALEALPPEEQRRLLHTLARLQLAQQQWQAGVQSLQQWMQQVEAAARADERIGAEDYLLLAHGHAQLEQWSQVLAPITTAIRLRRQAPEDWYRLQLAAHFELKQWPAATRLLEWLVNHYPQRTQYWEQLASVHQLRDRHAQALATLRAAWLAGRFTQERQYLWLVQLMLQQGVPQRAAELLASAIANGQVSRSLKHERLLAQVQLQAKQYAAGRDTLARIAKRQPDHQIWRQLAYLDLQLGHWDALKRSIEQAMALKPDALDLYLLSGIAAVNRADYAHARASFSRAREHQATREQAQSWLNYLEQIAAPAPGAARNS